MTDYKGQKATLYTYTVTNYKGDGEYIVADMLVSGGVLNWRIFAIPRQNTVFNRI